MRAKLLTMAVVLVLGFGSLAMAVNFGISGGSYVGNVATYCAPNGAFVNPATATTTGAATSSNPAAINDSLAAGWTAGNLAGANAFDNSATATIDLGQVWKLNQIYTHYNFFATSMPGAQYKLAVSTDGISYTTVVGPTAPTEQQSDIFAATDARYIQWTVTSVAGAGNVSNVGGMELMAYVASTAGTVPQKEKGYNIAREATFVSNTIGETTHSWQNRTAIFNGSFNANEGLCPDVIANETAIIDLGGSYSIVRISAEMYSPWSNGQIAISNTNNGLDWQVIKDSTPVASLSDSSYTLLAPTTARYIRIIGDNLTSNGWLDELQVFTFVPEPTSLSLLALGGLALLRRRR